MLTPHITEEQLRNYISGNMAQKEQVNFYRHIAGCTCCAGKLASAMQEEEIIYTPPGLREDILGQTVYNKRSIARNIKLFSFKSKKKQNEFLMYTAKVSFAVSLADHCTSRQQDTRQQWQSDFFYKGNYRKRQKKQFKNIRFI